LSAFVDVFVDVTDFENFYKTIMKEIITVEEYNVPTVKLSGI